MNQLLDYFFRNEEYAALADRQVKSNIYAEMGKRLNFRSARSDRGQKEYGGSGRNDGLRKSIQHLMVMYMSKISGVFWIFPRKS